MVSPLISLMKDQVEGLRANGIQAAFLNSAIDSREQLKVEETFYAGALQLLYVSPEKLVSGNFVSILKRGKINLFAIDEAHCISAWGHDFRPEYTQMGMLKQHFPQVPVIALTATADKLTRKDIVDQLKLEEPGIFIASFDRPNLSLEVRPGQQRLGQIQEFVQKRPKQAGIIYCLSRKTAEDVAAKLAQQGLKAEAYHAGLSPDRRSKIQDNFINDNIHIICATVAFGIDRQIECALGDSLQFAQKPGGVLPGNWPSWPRWCQSRYLAFLQLRRCEHVARHHSKRGKCGSKRNSAGEAGAHAAIRRVTGLSTPHSPGLF
nr:RecQ family ATP-dependent DNA helicase [Haliscomenobacter sp.]